MILILATLTDAIINQHSSLRGIAQQLAEVYYIVGAQQLDGYGQECFLAKDERGSEVLIGASLTGMYKIHLFKINVQLKAILKSPDYQ